MLLKELKLMRGNAPESGYLLAYTRTQVYFQGYSSIDEVEQVFSDKNLLELHLFDDDKEYRCLASRSRRFRRGEGEISDQDMSRSISTGIIETVADFGEEEACLDESLLVREHIDGDIDKITILNHISYDPENGMAYIDNYRLRIGGK